MNNKKKTILISVLIVAQIFIISTMIYNYSVVAQSAESGKVRIVKGSVTSNVGRNKIELKYDDMEILTTVIPDEGKIKNGDSIYVTYRNNDLGYMELENYYSNKGDIPKKKQFLTGSVSGIDKVYTQDDVNYGGKTKYSISVSFPFRYVFVKSADLSKYEKILKGESTQMYSEIKIKDGDSVLTKIVVDGETIKR